MKNLQQQVTLRILEADEGHVLTQATDVEPQNRVYSEKIYLAVNDSPENWMEITQEQADKEKEEASRNTDQQIEIEQ